MALNEVGDRPRSQAAGTGMRGVKHRNQGKIMANSSAMHTVRRESVNSIIELPGSAMASKLAKESEVNILEQ